LLRFVKVAFGNAEDKKIPPVKAVKDNPMRRIE